MPHFSFPVTEYGPLLQAFIGISHPRRQALTQSGLAVPPPIMGQFLVDTGASCTSLDSGLVGKLSLDPRGTVSVHTPSTGANPVQVMSYDIEVSLSGGHQHIALSSVIEGDFSQQGISGLLGRDFLMHARMTYCGPENQVYISF